MNKCVICNNKAIIRRLNYNHCKICKLDFISKIKKDNYRHGSINSKLSNSNEILINLSKFYTLKKLLKKLKPKNLLDFGCGKGSFLNYLRYKNEINDLFGIEKNYLSRTYAINHYKLKVKENINDFNHNEFSLITMWHSIEHLKLSEINSFFKFIKNKKNVGIFISVPNQEALLFKLFGKNNTYYDEDNHFFQFSMKSLDILCNKYNYHRKYKLNNFLYDFFGYFQSIQNFFTNSKNVLYVFFKRGNTIKNNYKIILNFLFLPLSLIIAFIIILISYILPYRLKPVINLYYETK